MTKKITIKLPKAINKAAKALTLSQYCNKMTKTYKESVIKSDPYNRKAKHRNIDH